MTGTKAGAFASVDRRAFVGGVGITLLGLGSGARAGTVLDAGPRFGFAPSHVPEGFLLDGKPFQMRSGEMHPARIPRAYWQHRIRMAKAMGLNTIAIYVMWNYHETAPGTFDFTSDNRDIAAFIRLCAAEGMLVYLRPGPYVCGEWDLGGLPAYLLKVPGIRLRHRDDATYMGAAERYIDRLATIVRPLMIDRGGPIAMVQIENEYASFSTDPAYLPAIRGMWTKRGFRGPFSTSDGLEQVQKAGTYLADTALGLDGSTDIEAAQRITNGAPVWIGEGYPGWLTHWGDPKFAAADYTDLLRRWMRERRSFNLYVVHGGTNFGFTAGANANNDGSKFEPSLTSYDYGAPIAEGGDATAQYHAMRRIITDHVGTTLPAMPPLPARIAFPTVRTVPRGSLWAALPDPVTVATPGPMELVLGQTEGMILYRHMLKPGIAGDLRIDGLHDEALVLIDGVPVGNLSRVAASKAPASLPVPPSSDGKARRLDILVYPFGRVNFGRYMEDRKGILGKVAIGADALTVWSVYGLPLDDAHRAASLAATTRPGGLFHTADFTLEAVGDTFIDMADWKLGFLWINGHLLGRHCALGPQTRLFCPADWLVKGRNRAIVFDLYASSGAIRGLLLSDTMQADRDTGDLARKSGESS
ncbi:MULTISPECIES: beta-galactosidase [unclassified Sphingomonas]|uniref:beta-galactosidase n=1 Tax=unclassified Sphingomonas TaxID=196159 RepID=UPI0009E712AF|nr:MULTISPECIES: beta-galactosidase [unclassified Sphingomonas]